MILTSMLFLFSEFVYKLIFVLKKKEKYNEVILMTCSLYLFQVLCYFY